MPEFLPVNMLRITCSEFLGYLSLCMKDRIDRHRDGSIRADEEALKAARQYIDGCDVEVRFFDRKIGQLERARNGTSGFL